MCYATMKEYICGHFSIYQDGYCDRASRGLRCQEGTTTTREPVDNLCDWCIFRETGQEPVAGLLPPVPVHRPTPFINQQIADLFHDNENIEHFLIDRTPPRPNENRAGFRSITPVFRTPEPRMETDSPEPGDTVLLYSSATPVFQTPEPRMESESPDPDDNVPLGGPTGSQTREPQMELERHERDDDDLYYASSVLGTESTSTGTPVSQISSGMQNGYGTDTDFGRPSQRSSSSRNDERNGGSLNGQ